MPNNSDQAAMHDELRARLIREADAHDYFASNPDLRMTTGDHAARATKLREIALSLPACGSAVFELASAAAELRQRQRDYLSGPKSERSEEKGRLVGVAAARVDAALAALSTPSPAAHAGGEAVAWVSEATLSKVGHGAVVANLYGYQPAHRYDRKHVPLYTHPSPMPVDALRELVEKWRSRSSLDWNNLPAAGTDTCIDELTALLSGGAAREDAK